MFKLRLHFAVNIALIIIVHMILGFTSFLSLLFKSIFFTTKFIISIILLSTLLYVSVGNINLFKALQQAPFEQWQLLSQYLLFVYAFSMSVFMFYDCITNTNSNGINELSDSWKEYKQQKEKILSKDNNEELKNQERNIVIEDTPEIIIETPSK